MSSPAEPPPAQRVRRVRYNNPVTPAPHQTASGLSGGVPVTPLMRGLALLRTPSALSASDTPLNEADELAAIAARLSTVRQPPRHNASLESPSSPTSDLSRRNRRNLTIASLLRPALQPARTQLEIEDVINAVVLHLTDIAADMLDADAGRPPLGSVVALWFADRAPLWKKFEKEKYVDGYRLYLHILILRTTTQAEKYTSNDDEYNAVMTYYKTRLEYALGHLEKDAELRRQCFKSGAEATENCIDRQKIGLQEQLELVDTYLLAQEKGPLTKLYEKCRPFSRLHTLHQIAAETGNPHESVETALFLQKQDAIRALVDRADPHAFFSDTEKVDKATVKKIAQQIMDIEKDDRMQTFLPGFYP